MRSFRWTSFRQSNKENGRGRVKSPPPSLPLPFLLSLSLSSSRRKYNIQFNKLLEGGKARLSSSSINLQRRRRALLERSRVRSRSAFPFVGSSDVSPNSSGSSPSSRATRRVPSYPSSPLSFSLSFSLRVPSSFNLRLLLSIAAGRELVQSGHGGSQGRSARSLSLFLSLPLSLSLPPAVFTDGGDRYLEWLSLISCRCLP